MMKLPLQLLNRIRGWVSAGRAETFPIGLHMGTHHLSMVQMQRSAGRTPAIRAAVALEYGCPLADLQERPQELKTLVQRALDGQPFKGKRVVACMPGNQVKIQLVNYSVTKGESDAEAIMREMRERMNASPDGVLVDWLQVRQENVRDQQKEAIVAMADRKQVTAYLDLLSGAGLRIDVLDIGPIALTRLMSWVIRDNVQFPPSQLLINFGTSASYLTVVWGRRLMLDRGIEFSQQRLVSRVSTLLEMADNEARQLLFKYGFAADNANDAEHDITQALREVLHPEFTALAAEIRKTLIYVGSKTRGRTVDAIYLIGSIARCPGLAEMLGNLLSIPVEVLDPFKVFPHRQDQKDKFSKVASVSGIVLATGLALRNTLDIWPIST